MKKYLNQKGLIQWIALLILAVALPAVLYLSQKTQIFKPRAYEPGGSFSISVVHPPTTAEPYATIRATAANISEGILAYILIKSAPSDADGNPLGAFSEVGRINCSGNYCNGTVRDDYGSGDSGTWAYFMDVYYIPPAAAQTSTPAAPAGPVTITSFNVTNSNINPGQTVTFNGIVSGSSNIERVAIEGRKIGAAEYEDFGTTTVNCSGSTCNFSLVWVPDVNDVGNWTMRATAYSQGVAVAGPRTMETGVIVSSVCSSSAYPCYRQYGSQCTDSNAATQYCVNRRGTGSRCLLVSGPEDVEQYNVDNQGCTGAASPVCPFTATTCFTRANCNPDLPDVAAGWCASQHRADTGTVCIVDTSGLAEELQLGTAYPDGCTKNVLGVQSSGNVLQATSGVLYCTGDPHYRFDPNARYCGNDSGSVAVTFPEGGPTATPTPPAGGQCPSNATACWIGAGCSNSNQFDANRACSQNYGTGSVCRQNEGAPNTYTDGCSIPATIATPTPTPPAGGTGTPPTAIVRVAAGSHGSTNGSYIGLNMKFQATAFGQGLTKVEVMEFNGTSSQSLGSQNCTGNTTDQCDFTTPDWPIEGGSHIIYVVAVSSGGRCAGGQGPTGESFEGSNVPRCHPRAPTGPNDTDDNLAISGATTLVPATYNVVRTSAGTARCVPVARPCTIEAINSATDFNQNVCDRAAFRTQAECESSAYFSASNVPMYCCNTRCQPEANQWDGRACWLGANPNQTTPQDYISNPVCSPAACNPGGGSFASGGIGTTSTTYQCQRDGTWRPTTACTFGDPRDPLTHCLVSGGPITAQYWIDYCRQLALGPTPTAPVTTYGCLGSTCLQGVAGGYSDSTCGGTRCSTTPVPTPTPTGRVTPTPTTPPGGSPTSVKLVNIQRPKAQVTDADCQTTLASSSQTQTRNLTGNSPFTIDNWKLDDYGANTSFGSRTVCAQFFIGSNLAGGVFKEEINYIGGIVTPTPTGVAGCVCQTDNTCSTQCVFNKHDNTTYGDFRRGNRIACDLDPQVHSPATPGQDNKNAYCNRGQRTRGDADGNITGNPVNPVDYGYYLRGVLRKVIPVSVNPDFNGDGDISARDLDIFNRTDSGQ